jgi:hypothetical protein
VDELPVPLRKARTAVRKSHAIVTAKRRMLPTFLIIGAQKAGTNSLHAQLLEHPDIGAPFRKEVAYLTHHYQRSVTWYRKHFPLQSRNYRHAGEATPYYLLHPTAPERAHALLPDLRLVAMLRNPVDRTHSHHNHEVTLGYETLSFTDALAAEEERLAGEEERLRADPTVVSYNHAHYSYRTRSRYAPQLERWLAVWPADRLLVMTSEDFYADPAGWTVRVQEFLGLAPVPPSDVQPRYAREYRGLDSGMRRRLAADFAEDNHRLATLLKRDFAWD